MLTETLIGEMVSEMTGNMDASFDARRPKGGEMPVVMGALQVLPLS